MRLTPLSLAVALAMAAPVPPYQPQLLAGNYGPQRMPTPGKRQRIANKKRRAKR